MLDKIADNLELNEIINENIEGDEIDSFKEKIKELVEKTFNETKGNIDSSVGESSSKKSRFIKAIMRVFSILLNANLSSVKNLGKILKRSANLLLH